MYVSFPTHQTQRFSTSPFPNTDRRTGERTDRESRDRRELQRSGVPLSTLRQLRVSPRSPHNRAPVVIRSLYSAVHGGFFFGERGRESFNSARISIPLTELLFLYVFRPHCGEARTRSAHHIRTSFIFFGPALQLRRCETLTLARPTARLGR